MLHLRVLSPADRTEAVLAALRKQRGIANTVLHRGAAVEPAGDVVIADIAREAASELLDRLRATGVAEHGSIALDEVAVTLSSHADRASEEAPGIGSEAVVWEQLHQQTGDETHLGYTYLTFIAIAGVAAGIGVVLDQPIILIGAMIVSPEFGPLAALALAIVRRDGRTARRASVAVVVGFAVAIAVTVISTRVFDAVGLISREQLLGPHPITGFIWSPDALSWVVGFLAGIAGVLSLTTAKSGPLIGVLVSVTTISAAAAAGTYLAYGDVYDALSALLQLLINLVAIVLAGVLTLLVQRAAHTALLRRSPNRRAALAAGRPERFDPTAAAGTSDAPRAAAASNTPDPSAQEGR